MQTAASPHPIGSSASSCLFYRQPRWALRPHSKLNLLQNFIYGGSHFFYGAIIQDIIVGRCDGATFFEILNFRTIAFANGGGIEGPAGAVGHALVAQFLIYNYGQKRKAFRELVSEDTVSPWFPRFPEVPKKLCSSWCLFIFLYMWNVNSYLFKFVLFILFIVTVNKF